MSCRTMVFPYHFWASDANLCSGIRWFFAKLAFYSLGYTPKHRCHPLSTNVRRKYVSLYYPYRYHTTNRTTQQSTTRGAFCSFSCLLRFIYFLLLLFHWRAAYNWNCRRSTLQGLILEGYVVVCLSCDLCSPVGRDIFAQKSRRNRLKRQENHTRKQRKQGRYNNKLTRYKSNNQLEKN